MVALAKLEEGRQAGTLVHHLPEPIVGPLDERDVSRADLVFSDIEHAGVSFTVHIFFNNEKAGENTARTDRNGYAGSFSVFGHGGCVGAPGHCDPRLAPRGPYDFRPQHPLTPTTITVVVTDALRRAVNGSKKGLLTITLVPIANTPKRADYHVSKDVLKFREMKLRTYA